MLTPNRIVAILTPLVFAPAAGAVSAWVANHAPGVELSEQELTNIFIAGALVALAPAAQWLHGWQKYEEREAQGEQAIAVATAMLPAGDALDEPADELLVEDDELDELDDLIAADDEDDEDPLIAGEPLATPAGA